MSLIDQISKTAPIESRVSLTEDILAILLKGSPAYVTTSATFIQPPLQNEVQVSVTSTDFMQVGNLVQIYDTTTSKGGYYIVNQVIDSTDVLLELQAYTYNTTAPGETIPNGSRVQISIGQPDFKSIFFNLLTGGDKNVSATAGTSNDWFTLQMPNANHALELTVRLHVAVLGFAIKRRYMILNKQGEPEIYVEGIDINRIRALAGPSEEVDVVATTSGTDSVIFTIDASNLSTDRVVQTRVQIDSFASDSGANITFA